MPFNTIYFTTDVELQNELRRFNEPEFEGRPDASNYIVLYRKVLAEHV